jgi:hypothetical protein
MREAADVRRLLPSETRTHECGVVEDGNAFGGDIPGYALEPCVGGPA